MYAPNFKQGKACSSCGHGILLNGNLVGDMCPMVKCGRYGVVAAWGVCDDMQHLETIEETHLEEKTYYDIIPIVGTAEKTKQYVENNGYGEVTDFFENNSISVIRAHLWDHLIGYLLKNKDIISIEKPRKCKMGK